MAFSGGKTCASSFPGQVEAARARAAGIVFEGGVAPQSATDLAIEVHAVFEDVPARLRRKVQATLSGGFYAESGEQRRGRGRVHVHHPNIQRRASARVKRPCRLLRLDGRLL